MCEIECHYGPTPEPSPEEGAFWLATTSGLLHTYEAGHWRPATPQQWARVFAAMNENALQIAGYLVQLFRIADAAVDVARNTTGVTGWQDHEERTPWSTFTPDLTDTAVQEFLDVVRPYAHRCEDALAGALEDHNTEREDVAPEVHRGE